MNRAYGILHIFIFAVQIELTSESDLFFHYTHTIGPAGFQQLMQEAQKLMFDFNSYPAVFLRMVNSCIQAPQANLAVLLMEASGAARLDFIQVHYAFPFAFPFALVNSGGHSIFCRIIKQPQYLWLAQCDIR